MKYSIGFSLIGFIIVLLPMIPNLFYFMFPDAFVSDTNENHPKILEIIENIGRFSSIALLICLIVNNDLNIKSIYPLLMAVFLLFYYCLWFLLFKGNKKLWVFMSLAIFPIVYFIFGGLWLNNFPAVIMTVIFGIAHLVISYINFSSK